MKCLVVYYHFEDANNYDATAWIMYFDNLSPKQKKGKKETLFFYVSIQLIFSKRYGAGPTHRLGHGWKLRKFAGSLTQRAHYDFFAGYGVWYFHLGLVDRMSQSTPMRKKKNESRK